MPAEQLIMRMISSLGQIDNKKLSTGKLEMRIGRDLMKQLVYLLILIFIFMMLEGLLLLKLRLNVEDSLRKVMV